MPGDVRRRSLLFALAVLAPSVAVYLLAWVLTIISPWWLWPVLSPLTGVAAGLLFVVAHDAAHDALTPYRAVNSLVGRILFLPAWHNLVGWVHAHNHIHHGWTNYQPRDYVWAPLVAGRVSQLAAVEAVLGEALSPLAGLRSLLPG